MRAVPSSVSKLIDSLDVPPPVKTEAKSVYLRLDRNAPPRSDNKKKIVCYCVYQAYVELNPHNLPDPHTVVKMLGLEPAVGLSAISTKMKYRDGCCAASPTVDPVEIMRGYANNILCLEESVVCSMAYVFAKVLESNKTLLAEQARVVVGAFILCYLDKNGFEINRAAMLDAVFLKSSSVSQVYKQMDIAMAEM